MGDLLSAWELRCRAGERLAGKPGGLVTHKQFELFREWGLIPAAASGGWPDGAVDILVRICQEEVDARKLPRRVLRLRRDGLRFPVPPEKLHRAMIEIRPTIKAPIMKMRRIVASERNSPYLGAGYELNRDLSPPRPWPLPAYEQWEGILNGVCLEGQDNLDAFNMTVGSMYYKAEILLLSPVPGRPGSIQQIPIEEVVTLLTIDYLWCRKCRSDEDIAIRSPS